MLCPCALQTARCGAAHMMRCESFFLEQEQILGIPRRIGVLGAESFRPRPPHAPASSRHGERPARTAMRPARCPAPMPIPSSLLRCQDRRTQEE
ncbi:hypothetical protein GQ55_5G088500 [Panicum hallii var. hallii]|uniref:Uncharacterized protein n=1 Tax=Panicum hallii var. hallii TaxID=1504633 RepID=A0A2T7DE87_9POAL|nr:hypothetical protein GQ55_5G088500 [Panicum hallii var. hallii]